jgi:hypothetical protein
VTKKIVWTVIGMVRIKLSPSKKRYLKGKNFYDYIRGHLPIPKRILTKLEPYFKEDFQAEMTEDNTKIAVTYTFLKNKTNKKAC